MLPEWVYSGNLETSSSILIIGTTFRLVVAVPTQPREFVVATVNTKVPSEALEVTCKLGETVAG